MSMLRINDPEGKFTCTLENHYGKVRLRMSLISARKAPQTAETLIQLSNNSLVDASIEAAAIGLAEHCNRRHGDNFDPRRIGQLALEIAHELFDETAKTIVARRALTSR